MYKNQISCPLPVLPTCRAVQPEAAGRCLQIVGNLLIAAGVAVLMLSLAGLPPLVGFFGKFFVFKAAVDAGLAPLAIAGAVASVIGAYYYLNIVKIMYLNEPGLQLQLSTGLAHRATLAVCALIMAAGWLPFLSGFGVPEVAAAAAESLLK